MELIRQAKGGQVSLDLEDHRDEEYVRPKVKVKPFSGQGNMLGRYDCPSSVNMDLTPDLSAQIC